MVVWCRQYAAYTDIFNIKERIQPVVKIIPAKVVGFPHHKWNKDQNKKKPVNAQPGKFIKRK